MGLIEKAALVVQLAPPLDAFLANQLVDEFVSLERRFIQRDWEPAQLDGGQFSEILARVLYHQDSGTLDTGKAHDVCLKYIEDPKGQNTHNIQPRDNALHLAKVLRTVYKFRSARGAVHISPTYKPNQMDAKFVMEGVRWCINDTLRIFWNGDREKVAKAIREILQFDVPSIGSYEDNILVQRTDLSPEEEVLVLLHYAGEAGFTRKHLGEYAKVAAQRVTDAIHKLTSAQVRQAIQLNSGVYRLTDLGSKRVRDQLADKLLVQ